MERRYREPKHDKKDKSYGFTEWDFCKECQYVQHYDMYKFQR